MPLTAKKEKQKCEYAAANSELHLYSVFWEWEVGLPGESLSENLSLVHSNRTKNYFVKKTSPHVMKRKNSHEGEWILFGKRKYVAAAVAYEQKKKSARQCENRDITPLSKARRPSWRPPIHEAFPPIGKAYY